MKYAQNIKFPIKDFFSKWIFLHISLFLLFKFLQMISSHFLPNENDQISIKKAHTGLQDKNYKLGWILDVALSILINKFVLSCFVKKILVYPFFVEGAGLPFFWSNAVNK